MAKKVEKPKQESAAQDLAVLFPDRSIRIGDQDYTVRKYSLKDSIDLVAYIRDFTAVLAQCVAGGQRGEVTDVIRIFEDRPELLVLVARSVDQNVDWLLGLDADESDRVVALWWAINVGFFARRLPPQNPEAGSISDSQTSSPA
jgi:hypothetical protein